MAAEAIARLLLPAYCPSPPPATYPEPRRPAVMNTAEVKAAKVAFLESLFAGEPHVTAIRKSGVPWRDIRHWICKGATNYDAEFAELYADAERCQSEIREFHRDACADDRGMAGWLEPQYYQGTQCGSRRVFSDSLLVSQMKKHNPEKFVDRIEHSGPMGGPIEMAHVPPAAKSLEDWETQSRKLHEAEKQRKESEREKP